MYTLSLDSCNTSGSLLCPLPVVSGLYIQCVWVAFKFKEGRKKKGLCVFKMFCQCSVAWKCICFSLPCLPSEANLLSIDDSDGPFSPSEERKVSTLFICGENDL